MGKSNFNKCKDCKERYSACHDKCAAYLESKSKLAEIKCKVASTYDTYVTAPKLRTNNILKTHKYR